MYLCSGCVYICVRVSERKRERKEILYSFDNTFFKQCDLIIQTVIKLRGFFFHHTSKQFSPLANSDKSIECSSLPSILSSFKGLLRVINLLAENSDRRRFFFKKSLLTIQYCMVSVNWLNDTAILQIVIFNFSFAFTNNSHTPTFERWHKKWLPDFINNRPKYF